MMRAVLDTNVFVSAMVITYGKPAQIVDFAIRGGFTIVLCDEIIEETDISLHRKHIQKRFQPTEKAIGDFLEKIRGLGQFVEITEIENLVPKDPPDNIILACAVEGKADYLVSGNLHLLNIKTHRGVQIIKPAQLLEILKPTVNTRRGETDE